MNQKDLPAKNSVQSPGFLLQQQIILLTPKTYGLLYILLSNTVEIQRHAVRSWQ